MNEEDRLQYLYEQAATGFRKVVENKNRHGENYWKRNLRWLDQRLMEVGKE